MSIERKEVDMDGFSAVIYTVSCDSSKRKMFEVLCRNENEEGAPVASVEAKWNGNPNVASEAHEIQGLLSYGPIDEKGQNTRIIDIEVFEEEQPTKISVSVIPVADDD